MTKIKVKNIAKSSRKNKKNKKNFGKRWGKFDTFKYGAPHHYFIGVSVYKSLIFNVLQIYLCFTDFGKIDRFAHKTH